MTPAVEGEEASWRRGDGVGAEEQEAFGVQEDVV